jgi:alkaline phosphatase D
MRRRSLSDLNRRQWLHCLGVGATSALLACDSPSPGDLVAAVLEPSDSELTVAIAGGRPGSAAIEVWAGEELVALPLVDIDADGFAAADIDGLAPDREYAIDIVVRGVRSGPYRARTAPHPADPRPVRIAVSADFDPNPEFATELVEHVLAAEPELFVSLGDFPYTDNGPVAKTVSEYRARHHLTRSAPAARRLFESVGVRAIYDDHEFRNDWDAMRAANEPERYAAALQVWDEYYPLRDATGDIRYRSWRWGAHVECFLLDVRRFRSANAEPDGPGKTMLGEVQRAWLVDGVRRSTATFKLVMTPVPLDFGIGDDHWAAFATERDLVLESLVGIPGVLFISGDQHYFAAYRHAFGVREFQVGPLARGIGPAGRVTPDVLFRHHDYNAAVLDVSAERLVISGVGPDGARFYEETFTPEQLTPRATIAPAPA